jgi:hypothetical protein
MRSSAPNPMSLLHAQRKSFLWAAASEHRAPWIYEICPSDQLVGPIFHCHQKFSLSALWLNTRTTGPFCRLVLLILLPKLNWVTCQLVGKKNKFMHPRRPHMYSECWQTPLFRNSSQVHPSFRTHCSHCDSEAMVVGSCFDDFKTAPFEQEEQKLKTLKPSLRTGEVSRTGATS